MRFIRSNTAVIITVGPFYSATDGVTIKTALTITNEKITLTADTDAGSAPTNILDNVTGATSGTANDLNYITGNDAGMMQMELAAADVNRVGRMMLSITDAANHVPVFHELFVLPAAIFDWLTGVIVPLPANMTQILGTAVPTPTVAGVPNVNVKTWNDLTTVALPLIPTTAGRTLDVAATGEAGLDFSNFAGTIGAATLATDTITAAKIAADAITAAKIADGAIDAATFAAGAINAAAIAADAITDAKVASDVTIASVTGAVGSVTAGVTVTTNNDKTGYGLSSAAVQAIWDAATSALTTAASIGKKLADWVVGTIDTYTGNTKQTGDNYPRLGAPAGASVSADIAAAKVDTAAIKVTTDKFVFTVANQVDSNVIDWKGATAPAMTGDAFARLGAPAGASVSADVAAVKVDTAAIKAKTDGLPSDPADHSLVIDATNAIIAAVAALNNLSAAGVRTAIGLASANLDTQLDALPTNAELATAFGTGDDAVLAQVALVKTAADAIKVKTDSLTYTVAGVLDANVQRINDVVITGDGSGSPYGV